MHNLDTQCAWVLTDLASQRRRGRREILGFRVFLRLERKIIFEGEDGESLMRGGLREQRGN